MSGASKECSECSELKPLGEFYPNRRNPAKVQGKCKECQKRYQREYRKRSGYREKERERCRKRGNHPSEKRKRSVRQLARHHRLTPTEAESMWARLRSEFCRICGRQGSSESPLHIDHDHGCHAYKDGSCEKCRRDPLCGTCNRGLGMFYEDPELLAQAAEYLGRWKS